MTSKAKWITSVKNSNSAVYTFRKEFIVEKRIQSALLYASAIGVYTPTLNGKRVGKYVLAPGWTSYNYRVQYQTYDVTELLTKENVLSFGLGQGWAVGYMGFLNENHYYAEKTALIAWLRIVFEDGTTQTVITNESWKVYTSETTFAEIYHGETIDRTAPELFIGNAILTDVKAKLIPQIGEPITEHERLSPIKVIKTPKNETVLDFGQNLTGYVEVKIRGKRGEKIVIHHAEVLDKDGNFYTENFRTARNEITYVLSGKDDVFKPLYSFQGFRYIRLTEYPKSEVDPNDFSAIAVHSDIERTGRFCCGNEKINQLYHNIIWGQKSNFLDVPTDCPQRDERLGWTGDAQVFCRTAAINFDVEKFFGKWLGDVRLEQYPNGAISGVVPNCIKNQKMLISAAWGDAICIIPWQLYLAYGNSAVLRENFSAMKKWVDYIHRTEPEEYLWLGGVHYGDWLAMDAGEDSYVGATSNDLVASAFFAYSTELLIKSGEIIGENVEKYKSLYKNIVQRFREYFMENGMPREELPYTEKLTSDYTKKRDTIRRGITQTALVLILHFNLCTNEERPKLARKLVSLINENGNLMSTGFVGTPYLLHTLSDNGYTELAYDLLLQEKNPSWLYSVCHGATTVWEHWNGIKEDGSFWSAHMNSFNHYAYGAVFDWIFSVSAGISTVESAPGYREITLAPKPDKRLGFVRASINSRNGKILSGWYYRGDELYFEFEIPDGVTAHIQLPNGKRETINGGSYCFGG